MKTNFKKLSLSIMISLLLSACGGGGGGGGGGDNSAGPTEFTESFDTSLLTPLQIDENSKISGQFDDDEIRGLNTNPFSDLQVEDSYAFTAPSDGYLTVKLRSDMPNLDLGIFLGTLLLESSEGNNANETINRLPLEAGSSVFISVFLLEYFVFEPNKYEITTSFNPGQVEIEDLPSFTAKVELNDAFCQQISSQDENFINELLSEFVAPDARYELGECDTNFYTSSCNTAENDFGFQETLFWNSAYPPEAVENLPCID